MKRKNGYTHLQCKKNKSAQYSTCNLQVVYSFDADWVVVDEGPAGVVA